MQEEPIFNPKDWQNGDLCIYGNWTECSEYFLSGPVSVIYWKNIAIVYLPSKIYSIVDHAISDRLGIDSDSLGYT